MRPLCGAGGLGSAFGNFRAVGPETSVCSSIPCYRVAVEGETELQMAKRHVREGAQRIARQRELLSELRDHGHAKVADAAEALLVLFIAIQRESIGHVKRIVQRQ